MNDNLIEEFIVNYTIDTDKLHDGIRILTIAPPDEEELNKYHTVTQEEYERFQYYYVMDVIKGWRYGQAFCERFGISNASPLYHFRGRETSERWIRDNYLVK